MCKILFQRTFGKQCLEVGCRRDSTAELLIGNSGLEFWAGLRRSRNDFGSQILDIGQWWFSEFGLPAVFAIWVVNTNLEPKLFSQVNEWLNEIVELCDSNIGIKLWANEISHGSIDIEIAKEFIYGLRYKLTREDRQSINILWDHLDAAQVTG